MFDKQQNNPAKNSLLVIVFSFNRALQLEYTLRTLQTNLLCAEMEVVVVYDTKGEQHLLAYERLKLDYFTVVFYKISAAGTFFHDIFPLLFNVRNLYRYLKYPYLRKNRNNFKGLTEQIIMDSPCGYVMFMTDDMVTFKPQPITHEIFDFIAKNPMQTSFRCYVGRNHHNVPSGVTRDGDFLMWNYYDQRMSNSWAYPFSVDGTIYEKNALMSVIKPALYHIPTTLEANIVSNVRACKLFSTGYSPLESTMVGVVLNKVQSINDNVAGMYDVEILNKNFLDGYRMEAIFEHPIDINTLIPEKILLRRENESVIVGTTEHTQMNGGKV